MGHANWLFVNMGTSFSLTAASVGFGPRGVLERLDMHEMGNINTVFRRNWESNRPCEIVGAADPVEREKCPNVKRPRG